MKVTEFTVKRKEWLHGEGSGGSFLLRGSDSKMCCLGFFCVAAGCDPADLAGVQVPHELDGECKAAIREQLIREDDPTTHPQVVNDLMTANDRYTNVRGTDMDIETEEKREEVITKLFEQMGVKVNFVD